MTCTRVYPLLNNESRYIYDLNNRFPCVLFQHLAPQPQLNGTTRCFISRGIMIGVPL